MGEGQPNGASLGLRWRGDIGPSFLLVAGQTVGFVIAATMIYASLSNTVANTKITADNLTSIVQRQSERNTTLENRLTKVETALDDVKTGVGKMADKIDTVLQRSAPH